MKLIVHPGWGKTGTTAIQNFLATSYEALKKHGILYPKAGREIDNAHHGLALALSPRGPYATAKSPAEILDEIQAEIDAFTACRSVLLSSELFPLLFENEFFADFAGRFNDVRLVFTVRPQSELLLSLYSQLICDPAIGQSADIYSIFLHHQEYLNFFQTLEKWQGKRVRKTDIVIYDNALLIERFLKALGVSGLAVQARRANESRGILATEVINALWTELGEMDGAKREGLVSTVDDLLSGIDARELHFGNLEFLNSVDNFYAKTNEKLAEKYLEKTDLFSEERSWKSRGTDLPVSSKTLIRVVQAIAMRKIREKPV